ncbi:peptidylprolyl isomerase [Methylibium rhizosphaerae]|uniref:peptidylprolyl isomerase n=1 Tax=Methylibium rhizosphaerae TaxID=2570323 RepID=UPI0011295F15|nr:peptidylprolyl isomerase [Methylibium rhizosphaerae]
MTHTTASVFRRPLLSLQRLLLAGLVAASAAPALAQQPSGNAPRTVDYIVAIVNRELVTNAEVQQRLARIQQEATRAGQRLPPRDELRRQVVDALIDERAQLTYARENGVRVDEAELDRAVASVAANNKVSVTELAERLRKDGIDITRFRQTLRDQLMLERIRDREVQGRIKASDAEIDAWLDKQRSSAASAAEYNIAQILIAVPESASIAQATQARERAEQALQRAQGGEAFDALVRELSNGSKEQGGQLGLRPADRLPDLFVNAVRSLNAGDVVPQVLRSGAGFHVLKLVEKRANDGLTIVQTRTRHILLRPSPQVSQEQAIQRLADFKRQIIEGRASFPQLARENSDDGSAAQGGDLGWVSPGQFVPEYEEAMNRLQPGQIADPVVSRFGVHLIQLMDRRSVTLDPKQQRDVARNAIREQKSEEAYNEWARDIRARAYVEMREPPQ